MKIKVVSVPGGDNELGSLKYRLKLVNAENDEEIEGIGNVKIRHTYGGIRVSFDIKHAEVNISPEDNSSE